MFPRSFSFNLHVGADADMTNKINVDISAMDAAYLGVKGLNIADDTGVAATYAVDAIGDALAKVSAQRSALGAVQNRLEHTIDNLDNIVENTTAAESRIRDTDMAEEMVEYSRTDSSCTGRTVYACAVKPGDTGCSGVVTVIFADTHRRYAPVEKHGYAA